MALPVTADDFTISLKLTEDLEGLPRGTKCGVVISLCNEEAPTSRYDFPFCAEYTMNSTLIQAARNGDRSAIELLEQRYLLAFTDRERLGIAKALLGRVTDDKKYWDYLARIAEEAIRFAFVDDEPTPEFEEWCAERAVELYGYRRMTFEALSLAGGDPRGRPLLEKALQSQDWDVFEVAVATITELRDESLLPAIEENLQRFPDGEEIVPWLLAGFRSDAADALALKLLPEKDHDEYREQRRELDALLPQP